MSDIKQKHRGAVKHCVFGNCNSDNRVTRRGYDPNIRFYAFPKPCLVMRKLNIYDKKIRNGHIARCKHCQTCNLWVKRCKRADNKFSSIANITKDTYICDRHFPDKYYDTKLDYNSILPHSDEQLEALKNRRERTVLAKLTKCTATTTTTTSSNWCEDVAMDIDDHIVDQSVNDCQELDPVNNSFPELVPKYKDAAVCATVLYKSVSTQTTFTCKYEIKLREEKKELEKKLRLLMREKTQQKEVPSTINKFEKEIEKNDKMCKFYTGLVFAQIHMLLSFLCVDESTNVKYWGSNKETMNPKRKKLSYRQELILTLVRLRSGLLLQDLAYRFYVSHGHISKIFKTWIQIMYNKFNDLRPYMFPSREKIKETLPASFWKLKNIRVIVDCTEIFCQFPSNFEHQGNLYSNYKAHTTFKVLLGCTPNGAVSFVSELFEGSISDRKIVEKSKLMDLLEDGDLVLADRGFTIKDLTDEKNVSLNIPAFLKGRDRLTAEEEVETKITSIAKNRIYVEHVVGRIKQYRLLKKIIPLSMRGILSQCVFVCACLLNFSEPIVH